MAFILSVAAASLISLALIAYLIYSIPPVRTAISKWKLKNKVNFHVPDIFFAFLHHFFCLYYSTTLYLWIITPTLSRITTSQSQITEDTVSDGMHINDSLILNKKFV
jgi:hypothetical protein